VRRRSFADRHAQIPRAYVLAVDIRALELTREMRQGLRRYRASARARQATVARCVHELAHRARWNQLTVSTGAFGTGAGVGEDAFPAERLQPI